MNIKIREYNENDMDAVKEIWNQVVRMESHFHRKKCSLAKKQRFFSNSRHIQA